VNHDAEAHLCRYHVIPILFQRQDKEVVNNFMAMVSTI